LEAYNRRGLISIQLNRFRETVINYEKFLGQIQGDEERRIFEAKVDIENNLAFTLILMGWPEKGRAYAQKALQDSLRMTNMVQATIARLMLSLANGHLCHYETALDNARLGFELAENQQNQRTISYLHIAAAQAKLGLGHADSAWDHTLQALALAERYSFSEIASEAYCLQGDALRFLQDYERASEYYRRGASNGAENFHTIDNSFHLGFMLGMSGKMDEGMNLLEQAIVYGERYELGLITIRAKMSKASVLLKNQQFEEALNLAYELGIEGQERRLELVALHSLNISGQAAVMQMQGATATKFAQKLIGNAKDMHNPWLEIEGLKSFLTVQSGDVQAATRLSRLLAEIGEHSRSECLSDSYKKFHAVAMTKLH
jgi:tetratricopeptide (TPR) repeat protein